MKAIIQRVTHAIVEANGEFAGEIKSGLLVLLGVAQNDTEQDAAKLSSKIARLRIFCDDNGKLSRSVIDTGGEVLVVSNFTLCGNCSHGNRPDFAGAAKSETAKALYLKFISEIKAAGVSKCATGQFGANMKISTELDGPVTFFLDTETL